MLAVTLMVNSSPTNYVTKSLTSAGVFTGVFRDGTDILNPTIILDNTVSQATISSVNYMYIAEFHRYYFITEISTDVNGLWEITGHVDVLMTYSTGIRSQNAIVARQEFVYNMYLDDGWFMAYQDPLIFSHPFSEQNPFGSSNHSFILTLAGS